MIRDIVKKEDEQREMRRPQMRSRTYAPFTSVICLFKAILKKIGETKEYHEDTK